MPVSYLFSYATLLEIHSSFHKYQLQSDIHRFETINLEIYHCFQSSFKNLDYKDFKVLMKTYLLKNCFYTINEILLGE